MTDKSKSSQDLQILILVNDLFLSIKIGSLLRQLGYSFQVTASEPDALRILQTTIPRMIILDLNFLHDGLKIIERVRKEEATKEIPIFAFCRHTEKEVMKKAKSLGCTEVLSRPEFLKKLPSLVKSASGGPKED